MRRLIVAGVVVAFLVPSLASAGGAGNPASTIGKENYGFTLELEKQVKTIDGDLSRSERLLGKVIWGVADKIDLYAKLGASDLTVEVPQRPDYEGKRGMTWGGGLRYLVAEIEQPVLASYLDVQVLSFYTDGTIIEPASQGGDVWIDKFDNRYKWNEVQLSFITTWHRDIFRPYLGFGLTNLFGNVEKSYYMVSGGVQEFRAREAYDFREDAIPELIFGVDIGLGGSGRLSGEMRYSEDEHVSFFVGLSELYR